jgi:hypothetical protein
MAAGSEPPLARHRIVYESDSFEPGRGPPHLVLFEVVPDVREAHVPAPIRSAD